ncbi:unnamed protein product [Mytilus coruscus]|uniref:Uncharacterized protein n=1 Tax=Mytilus coruscus TaxID=42192 RepID=A0A6J8ES45_MYTCO|nr:unnamed protein product [Mytilus coruscus]
MQCWTLPLNHYAKEKVTGTPINFTESYNMYNEQSEINTTEQNITQQEVVGIYDIGDVFLVTIEKLLHVAVLTETVRDMTKPCSMELYEEDPGSVFKYVATKTVSAECIFEELATESYKKIDDNGYILDEDVLDRVNNNDNEDHLTITEQIREWRMKSTWSV